MHGMEAPYRYFLELSYKGTHYNGWQIQDNASSIQAVFNEKLSMLLREDIYCIGCGRTDTGVHARVFYLHFDTTTELDAQIVRKLNIVLPKDIAVHAIYAVPAEAHTRWSALERTYTYLITLHKDPFLQETAAYLHYVLDIAVMNEAAAVLLEYHDFEALSKINTDNKHHLCSIYSAGWKLRGDKLVFVVTANRFLRGMVRILVGTMLLVGRGKMSVADFRALIESRNRQKSGPAAPAEGLYLSGVKYPEGLLRKL